MSWLKVALLSCLRYCKSTIFQANHNKFGLYSFYRSVVCDTAKVRFFKQITTSRWSDCSRCCCLRYCKSTIFQANHNFLLVAACQPPVVCDTAKVRFFKQITTVAPLTLFLGLLFAILQKYDFSSKSQQSRPPKFTRKCCLRYCKSTIFQANHNEKVKGFKPQFVVCDTAKVRFFKQITTICRRSICLPRCLRYCKSTIFQANHNTNRLYPPKSSSCLRYCKSTIFQANHNSIVGLPLSALVVCDTAKVRFFKQITT